MDFLFILIFAGYALGALSALIFAHGRLARALPALGAVIGSGSAFALGVSHLFIIHPSSFPPSFP